MYEPINNFRAVNWKWMRCTWWMQHDAMQWIWTKNSQRLQLFMRIYWIFHTNGSPNIHYYFGSGQLEYICMDNIKPLYSDVQYGNIQNIRNVRVYEINKKLNSWPTVIHTFQLNWFHHCTHFMIKQIFLLNFIDIPWSHRIVSTVHSK